MDSPRLQMKRLSMPLMERVGTLLRVDVDELLDRAEDPEQTIRQLLLDMENQLLQVKTQVAMTLADQHMLEKRQHEQEARIAAWHRRAERAAVDGNDALARAALERMLTQETMHDALRARAADQRAEVDALRVMYVRLQEKIAGTGVREVRSARYRVAGAKMQAGSVQEDMALIRGLKHKRARARDARSPAQVHQTSEVHDLVEQELVRSEAEDKVDLLLVELKERCARLRRTG